MNRVFPCLVGILCLGTALPAAAQEQDDRTLLAVVAHADDEFLVSPLLARYAREGVDVHLAIVTRGEKWAPQTDLAPGDEIAAVRAEEARCAAEALGISPPIQLSFDDGSLGERVTPPWTTLSQVEEELREILVRVQPDVVVTWGPEGGYGHTEHRLVGAVVTQLVQQKVEGAPEHLLYAGIPSERVPEEPQQGDLPWEGTHKEYLTVQVPYTEADLKAVQESFACYESQFPAEVLQYGPLQAHRAVWQGEVFLRPWFGEMRGDDVFALQPGAPVSSAKAREVSLVAASIDSLMTDLRERGYFVSGAVVAGREGETLYERGFGLANLEEGVPFTPQTPMNGASMGKTLTATAILMLEEEGKIRLDDRVSDHLPEFPYSEVRVRHLIEHSSGLHPDRVYFSFLPYDADELTNELLLDLLAEHRPPLALTPGTGFYYSGAGFNVGATLIERVTDKSYISFVRERLLEPLDMDSSFLPLVEGWKGVRTRGYRRSRGGELELYEASDNRAVYGQGLIAYSARDLYRWVSSFYARPLLGESALRSGLEPPVLGDGHRSGLTLLNWYYPDTGRRFYFTGDNRGFYTFAYWDADRRHAFVYMSNTLLPNWLRPRLAMALIDILEGRRPAPIEDPRYAVEGAPAESWNLFQGVPSLDDFTSILGEYETQPAGEVSIENPPPDWLNVGWILKDGWFAPVARVDGGLRYNMFPVEPGMFYVPGLNAWVGFTESDGEPTLHWTRVFEGTSTGTRVSAGVDGTREATIEPGDR